MMLKQDLQVRFESLLLSILAYNKRPLIAIKSEREFRNIIGSFSYPCFYFIPSWTVLATTFLYQLLDTFKIKIRIMSLFIAKIISQNGTNLS